MNTNAAVFGLCGGQEGGYGSPQHYPTSEQLSAFYGSGGGSGGSGGDPGSPSPYPIIHSDVRTSQPETKYEPNPSHSPPSQSGIISSDNGLQYANLDGSGDIKGYPAGYPTHHQYGAHHASLVQASYAHHYGRLCSKTKLESNFKVDYFFFLTA